MLAQVFAGTTIGEARAGAGVIFCADIISLPFTTSDCASSFILWLLEWIGFDCFELAASLVEAPDTVLEIERLCFVMFDIGY